MCKEVFCMYIYSAGDGCMVHLGELAMVRILFWHVILYSY